VQRLEPNADPRHRMAPAAWQMPLRGEIGGCKERQDETGDTRQSEGKNLLKSEAGEALFIIEFQQAELDSHPFFRKKEIGTHLLSPKRMCPGETTGMSLGMSAGSLVANGGLSLCRFSGCLITTRGRL
jgi:hypothetical protein